MTYNVFGGTLNPTLTTIPECSQTSVQWNYMLYIDVLVCTGCDPHIMGIGPVPAVEAMLEASNDTLDDIDMFDVRQHRYFLFCICCYFRKKASCIHNVSSKHNSVYSI